MLYLILQVLESNFASKCWRHTKNTMYVEKNLQKCIKTFLLFLMFRVDLKNFCIFDPPELIINIMLEFSNTTCLYTALTSTPNAGSGHIYYPFPNDVTFLSETECLSEHDFQDKTKFIHLARKKFLKLLNIS